MHSEFICVHQSTLKKLLSHDCKTIAVGTTSVRTLESLYYLGLKLYADKGIEESKLHVGQWEPYDENQPKLTPQEAINAILDYMSAKGISTIYSSAASDVYKRQGDKHYPFLHPDNYRTGLRLQDCQDACHQFPSATKYSAAACQRIRQRRLEINL